MKTKLDEGEIELLRKVNPSMAETVIKSRELNKADARLYIKDYNEKNRDKIARYAKNYYEKNKDKKKQYARDYYARNKDKKDGETQER